MPDLINWMEHLHYEISWKDIAVEPLQSREKEEEEFKM